MKKKVFKVITTLVIMVFILSIATSTYDITNVKLEPQNQTKMN